MLQKYSSPVGIILVCIYFLLIGFAVLEGAGDSPHSMDGLAFMILTAPGSFVLMVVFDGFGILTEENGHKFLPVFVIFGATINGFLLCVVGYVAGRIFGLNRRNDRK